MTNTIKSVLTGIMFIAPLVTLLLILVIFYQQHAIARYRKLGNEAMALTKALISKNEALLIEETALFALYLKSIDANPETTTFDTIRVELEDHIPRELKSKYRAALTCYMEYETQQRNRK